MHRSAPLRVITLPALVLHSASAWGGIVHRALTPPTPARLLRAALLGALLALALAGGISWAGELAAPPDGPHASPAPGKATVSPVVRVTGPPGSLTGSVTLGPKMISRPARLHLYAEMQPPPVADEPTEADEMANVVIYLEGPSPEGLPAVEPANRVMEQSGERFVPHVLPVLRGTTVEFPNSDPIFHNVFSLSKASSFDLGRYPRDRSKSVRFDEPGIVKVFCHIHSNMSAAILVLENPFFATPGPDGRFRIDGIPPGEYRAVGWHERAKPIHLQVVIEQQRTARLDFNIPLEAPAESGARPSGEGRR